MPKAVALSALLVSLALVVMLALPGEALSPPPVPPAARATLRANPSPQAQAHCPPLPPPTGNLIHVGPSQADDLDNIVTSASTGDTIVLADGTYHLGGAYLRFAAPGVSLRSASGNREAVILDGGYQTTEIIQIVASDVVIADVTLRRAYDHPIHVMSAEGSHTTGTTIYNVHIADPGQQAIKINPVPGGYYPDAGLIACSHIELTDAGRPHIRDNCYTGGVDAHQARDWVLRDNLIEGFWCVDGLSEHGIHLWRGCRDTIVERNVLRENARGIGFGLATSGSARTYADDPCPSAGGGYVDHYGGTIRNNFVHASRSELFASEYGFDCGVCLWQACGAQVLHNTVASTQAPFSSIEWRFENTDVDIVNNLVTHNLQDRGGTAHLAGNLDGQPISLFVDGPGGDLHLVGTATAAIDQGATLGAGACDDDIDGDPRPTGVGHDVGADEYGTPPPAAVKDLRVLGAVTGTGVLTVTLGWTAPADAYTYALRYSAAPIDEANWGGAAEIPVPFPASSPGTTEQLTASASYDGGTAYWALKSQNGEGTWADLSNIAFWPRRDVLLPLVEK